MNISLDFSDSNFTLEIVSPEVIGANEGICNVEIKFKDSGETYSIDLPWGEALLPYLRGEK